ncbi:hypothetical protein BJX64DRAFT_291763 [Aspergillus heterothallicus]
MALIHAPDLPWHIWRMLMVSILVASAWIPLSTAATVPTRTLTRRDVLANGVELRVLPIGDSITKGSKSSDNNGYRQFLHKRLEAYDNKIDFVGGEHIGSMTDNDHEGHGGYTIHAIQTASPTGIWASPNIALLHAGTNNMKSDAAAARAPDELRSLMDDILEHAENVLLFVAKIIPSSTGSYQTRINAFNKEVENIVNDYRADDKNVRLVSMDEAVDTSMLDDNLHPDDIGYANMAQAWYEAIIAADEDNLIGKPGEWKSPPSDSTSEEECQPTPSWYRRNQIANGAKIAKTDGPFVQVWSTKRDLSEGHCKRDQVRFMDLDGDGLKDYACVDPDTGAVTVWRSKPDSDGKPSGEWESMGKIATGKQDRAGKQVIFADLNGDGRDDYIYIHSTGDVSAWINQAKGSDGTWLWQDVGKISEGVGATPESLQMVDIDGDGRDDFLLVDTETGSVKAWLNTGASGVPDYYRLNEIATGASATENDKVIMGDFTGEGRADYMLVGKTGKVTGFVNRMEEDTLVPRWMAAVTVADGPADTEQDEVRLVDMTGDGQVDYLRVDEKTGKVSMWENLGTGGSYMKGDGVELCDLDGDGVMDYFWLDINGRGWGYLNIGQGENLWYDLKQIANGPIRDRSEIRMGVITDSKRADYIVVDKTTGQADWWKNLGHNDDGSWKGWSAQGQFATGPKDTVENQFKVRFTGKNVRFADLDGDKLDDYLYITPTGGVIMWRNTGQDSPRWHSPVLVADGVGVTPDHVHFADTNGDGLLDYVVVGSTTGKATTYHNLGIRGEESTDGTPGSIRWDTPRSFADGTGYPGRTIRLAEMTGDKRADYVFVSPDNGRLVLWENRCLKFPFDPDSGSDLCAWDATDPAAWDGSGAGKLVDDYIVEFTEEDWLADMDVKYNLGAPPSTLDCGKVDGNSCPLPDGRCADWDPPSFWWVRVAANKVQSTFNIVREKLQDESIVNLASVKPIINDFKMEVPEESLISKIFGQLSAAVGMGAAIATFGRSEPVANLMGLLGASISLIKTELPEDTVQDLDDVESAAQEVVISILTTGVDNLQKTLPQFWGNEDISSLRDLYDQLRDSGLVEDSGRKRLPAQVLHGGAWLDTDSENSILDALLEGVEATKGMVMGNLLTALRYTVINAMIKNEYACDLIASARWVDDECIYLVRRPKGEDNSESVPADVIDKMENKYGIELYDLLKNVKECNNNNATSKKTISVESYAYPFCYFGLPYVKSANQLWPFWEPSNAAKLPEWVSQTDRWNEGFEKACTLDGFKEDHKEDCAKATFPDP